MTTGGVVVKEREKRCWFQRDMIKDDKYKNWTEEDSDSNQDIDN